MPLAARCARVGLALRRERAVGAHLDTFLAQPLADEELERRPRAPRDVEQAVDLPLGEGRRRRGGQRPSRPSSAAPELPRKPCALLDRAFEPLLALETS